MLSKKFKLPISEFPRQGLGTINGSFLTIKTLPNNLNFSRFGVIISSRYDKRAVYRNQLRRKLFSFISQSLDGIKPGYDILIITKPSTKSSNNLDIIISDFKQLIKKIK